MLFPLVNKVLQSFLQSLAAIKESILQADKALTDGEKVIAGTALGLGSQQGG